MAQRNEVVKISRVGETMSRGKCVFIPRKVYNKAKAAGIEIIPAAVF